MTPPASLTRLALLALGLAFTPLAQAQSCDVAPTTSATARHGTKVDWYADRTKAYALAKKTGRPVFEMHISGEFANPGLT